MPTSVPSPLHTYTPMRRGHWRGTSEKIKPPIKDNAWSCANHSYCQERENARVSRKTCVVMRATGTQLPEKIEKCCIKPGHVKIPVLTPAGQGVGN